MNRAQSASDWPAPWRGDPTARPSNDRGHNLTQRFQEGLGFDIDTPRQFLVGIRQGEGDPAVGRSQLPPHMSAGGPRPNQNVNVFEKPPAETVRERAHPGSAAWVEAPWHLDAFAAGARDEKCSPGSFDDQPYASAQRYGHHYSRPSHARIED